MSFMSWDFKEVNMDTKDLSKFSIRTSDRRVFRRCLRKWDFQSSLRQNLTRAETEQNINFWFGSAIHFCMEDYHGYNRFGDPRRTFYAYYNAFKEDERPLGAEAHYDLGISMLTYYLTWMRRHNAQTGFETVWFEPGTYNPVEPGTAGAVPACEIEFFIPLNAWAVVDLERDRIISSVMQNPETGELIGAAPAGMGFVDEPQDFTWDGRKVRVVRIFYHGTIDRIVKDRFGRYWLWDYKTAKSADTAKLATDDQVSAYLWAARQIFPFDVYGFVYLQMTKSRAAEPKRLKNGELSCDKRQATTYGLYREALINDYGDVNSAPSKMIETLNHLAAQEEPEGDKFIRWDFVKRNSAQLDATERAIYGELSIMLNPMLYCFPSPTRDCSWDCPFRDACIMMDSDDNDGLETFMLDFKQRPHSEDGNRDEWRDNIKWPSSNEDLLPIENVINFDAGMLPEYPEEEASTFQFYYEEDC